MAAAQSFGWYSRSRSPRGLRFLERFSHRRHRALSLNGLAFGIEYLVADDGPAESAAAGAKRNSVLNILLLLLLSQSLMLRSVWSYRLHECTNLSLSLLGRAQTEREAARRFRSADPKWIFPRRALGAQMQRHLSSVWTQAANNQPRRKQRSDDGDGVTAQKKFQRWR